MPIPAGCKFPIYATCPCASTPRKATSSLRRRGATPSASAALALQRAAWVIYTRLVPTTAESATRQRLESDRGYEGDPYAPAPRATEDRCANDHPWQPETTRVSTKGGLVCLICSRASRRASYARSRGKVPA